MISNRYGKADRMLMWEQKFALSLFVLEKIIFLFGSGFHV